MNLDKRSLVILSIYVRIKFFWFSCSSNLMKMIDNVAFCVFVKKEDIFYEIVFGDVEIDIIDL